MLHLAAAENIPPIQTVYQEAGAYSRSLGSTNVWDMNTPYCEKLIHEGELFCSEDEVAIRGAVRLTTATNPQEWPDGNENHLFIAKLATGDSVRGTGYLPRVMLPEIEQHVADLEMDGLRLNCFPDEGLMNFYKRCGFGLTGIVTFDSASIGRQITTAKFEKPLGR